MSNGMPRAHGHIVVLCLAVLPAIAASADLSTATILGLTLPDSSAGLRLTPCLRVGYETGQIPDGFADICLSVAPWEWLEIGGGAVLLWLPEPGEYRIGALGATVGLHLRPTDWLATLPFLSASVHLGDPIVRPYTGDLPTVSDVVSPRAEGGFDLSGGLALGIGLPLVPGLGTALVIAAAYERTEGRDTSLGLADEHQRLAFHVAPVVILGGDSYPKAVAAWTQSFVYWFGRGYHCDSVPQITVALSHSLAVTAGVSAPLVGGRVWRLFADLRLSVRFPPKVPKVDEGIRIVLEELHFPPDSPDLFGFDDPKPVEENRRILSRLYEQLQDYPDHRITVEGHTSFVHWNDPVLGPKEEREELFPLSQARAEAVRAALVELGIDARRIVAVGKAATEPVVPFSDTENQWKNRRVVVVLRRV